MGAVGREKPERSIKKPQPEYSIANILQLRKLLLDKLSKSDMEGESSHLSVKRLHMDDLRAIATRAGIDSNTLRETLNAPIFYIEELTRPGMHNIKDSYVRLVCSPMLYYEERSKPPLQLLPDCTTECKRVCLELGKYLLGKKPAS